MSFILPKRFSTLFKKKKTQDEANNQEQPTSPEEEIANESKPAKTQKNKKSKKIENIYDSTKPTFIDQIPQELKMEIVKHLELFDILRLGMVSKSWTGIICKEELWKLQVEKTMNGEILTHKFLEDNQVETWKQAFDFISRLKWDEKCKDFSRIEISEKGKIVEDVGEYCRFCVARTAQGFTKGKHYWEVKVISGSCDAFNIYIGVSVKDLNALWKLGTKPDESWAIRGCDGKIYFSDQTEDCSAVFKESDVVGVYLDMDLNPPALCWYVHGRYSRVFRIQNIRGPRVLYPAVSMINKGEKVALQYPVPVPSGLPKIE